MKQGFSEHLDSIPDPASSNMSIIKFTLLDSADFRQF